VETENLKVLLVDDVDFFRDVMRDYFKRSPVRIFMAKSGQEAIEIASREHPDLIYMDVAMPGMSGIEACIKLKENQDLREIPVLLIFTPLRDAALEEIKASGCDGYLVKPFGREEFLNLGHRYLFHIERRERRVPCQMTVDFTISGMGCQARAADISANGFYVEFREEVPQEKNITFSFILPTVSAHRVNGKGRIAWLNQGFPRSNLSLPQGFGVAIQSIDEQSVAVIRSYLEQF
jgi:CheY-like chemotaxis protein